MVATATSRSAERIAGALAARRDELVAAAREAIASRLPTHRDPAG